MSKKTIVVVGGVAGGMSFATRYRRLNQNDEIIIIEKGPYVSFANCGLPYYVSKEISERSDLIVAEQAMLENRFNLNIKTNTEAVKINSDEKNLVVVTDGVEQSIAYDKLVLSPGASPIKIPIEGIEEHDAVFTLRNIPDVDSIVDYLDTIQPKSAVVIGAGFIGLEMAENLKKLGLNVSVVELAPHVLPPFDVEMASFAASELKRNDINLYTGNQVMKFENKKAHLANGEVIDADLVIMSVGVAAETKFTKGSGIELGMRNGFIVDDNYETTVKDIYAVGDAIIVKNTITKEDTMIPLASPANRQGRQLADILSGIKHNGKGSLGTAILRLFDLTFASTGLNERSLNKDDISIIHLHGKSHAAYFPNATPIDLKIIFDKHTHKILGAQAVGKKGVDKRIDVIATAIKAEMSVIDLQELELTYAPPFGSAKDIVNMAGYVAQNLILEITKSIQWNELKTEMEKGSILIDVRDQSERDNGHINGSLHIPLDELRKRMSEVPKDKQIIVHCHSAVRSYNAELILRNAGYDVRNLDGSYSLYSQLIEEGVVTND